MSEVNDPIGSFRRGWSAVSEFISDTSGGAQPLLEKLAKRTRQ